MELRTIEYDGRSGTEAVRPHNEGGEYEKGDFAYCTVSGVRGRRVKVFIEILRKTGQHLTRKAFINAAENAKNLDIGTGNSISYAAENLRGFPVRYPTTIRSGGYPVVDWRTRRDWPTEQSRKAGLKKEFSFFLPSKRLQNTRIDRLLTAAQANGKTGLFKNQSKP